MGIERAIHLLKQVPLTRDALTYARRVCIENGIKPSDIDLAMVFFDQGNISLATKYIAGPSPRPSPGAIALLETANKRKQE